jgi:hypothetical protein
MPQKKYDILTFCIYCQRDQGSPEKLQNHVLAEHKNTYAYNRILMARATRKKT